MNGRGCSGRAQRGAALLALAAILAGAVSWFAVSTLERAAKSRAVRDATSAQSLARAKEALLAYVAHYAARVDHQVPGRLPCPEPLSPPAGQEGIAASLSCTSNTQSFVGRLPWRTLGIEQLRDGDGEPLWYVLGAGFRTAPINFDSAGGLSLDGIGQAAVALVIAPGAPLDTLLEPAAPPTGCARTGQSGQRRPQPFIAFDPAQFLECGNATGDYRTAGGLPWSNDRVLAVTAADLMRSIAGPLADRLQRVVAPAIAAWDQAELAATGKSWGVSHGAAYLPFAARFGRPSSSSHCGSAGEIEGLPPIAARASGTCSTAWTGNETATALAGLDTPVCTSSATELRCTFRVNGFAVPASARIVATAPNAATSFRGTLAAADVFVSHGGTPTLAMSLDPVSAAATATVDIAWPSVPAAGDSVFVTLPQLPDARVLQDPRLAWFFSNQWYRHVHYAIASSRVAGATASCSLPGDPGCLLVHGLPRSTGNAWDKGLVLTLMGRALPAQSRSCATDLNANAIADCDDPAQYLEGENAVPGDGTFRADWRVANPVATPPPWPPFNDRLAVCPLRYTRQNGTTAQVCS